MIFGFLARRCSTFPPPLLPVVVYNCFKSINNTKSISTLSVPFHKHHLTLKYHTNITNTYNIKREFTASSIQEKTTTIKRKQRPKRLEKALQVRDAIMERWIPCARGNMKRLRAGKGGKSWSRTSAQKSRQKKIVYATRSQLRKLKKMIPHSYVTRKQFIRPYEKQDLRNHSRTTS